MSEPSPSAVERAREIVARFRSKYTPRIECSLCREPWFEDHHHDDSGDGEIPMYGPQTVTTISWDADAWIALIARALDATPASCPNCGRSLDFPHAPRCNPP